MNKYNLYEDISENQVLMIIITALAIKMGVSPMAFARQIVKTKTVLNYLDVVGDELDRLYKIWKEVKKNE